MTTAATPFSLAYVQAPTSNGIATAGMVLGIIGAFLEWGGILTLTLGVLAIIFGNIGNRRARTNGKIGQGRAVAGVVLGAFTVLAYLFWGLVSSGILWII